MVPKNAWMKFLLTGRRPLIIMENFDTAPNEGTNTNLTTTVTSDFELIHDSPYWKVDGEVCLSVQSHL